MKDLGDGVLNLFVPLTRVVPDHSVFVGHIDRSWQDTEDVTPAFLPAARQACKAGGNGENIRGTRGAYVILP
ncbi:MAG: hypothetical protein DRP37_05900 [Thermodesulfobacteriota bacterium]|nr:MAG: hypothetical protein DRP37_05900 [Thermodesulfobacteriota bacterium]